MHPRVPVAYNTAAFGRFQFLFFFLHICACARWKIRNVHMQLSIGFLMSARCMDLGTLLKLVPSIYSVVSIM